MQISISFSIYMALPLGQPEPVLGLRDTEIRLSLPLVTLVYWNIIGAMGTEERQQTKAGEGVGSISLSYVMLCPKIQKKEN